MTFPITHDLPFTMPFLTVNFSGLLLLKATSGTTCEIGIHRKSPPHNLEIALDVTFPDGTILPTEKLVTGHLQGKWFSLNATLPTQPGVWAYQADYPFYRSKGTDDTYDFRWSVDLEGDEFYREQLSASDSKVHPGMRMNNGVFYAARLTDETKVMIVRNLKSKNYGMSNIAGMLAAAVDVQGGGRIDLDWKNNHLVLPRQGDPQGTKYKLMISNEPPSYTPEEDELKNYHTALKKKNGATIPESEKWHLLVSPIHSWLENTDEIPCMPVILDSGN